ncbi:MAG: hypothetical protein M1549_00345 [Candidatus Dependentiae bacterium]|nr:hypothetical protein [Candidatus Dependentiae bacterium]
MKKNQLTRSLPTILYATISALWRLIPHWPNFTPFTALALYSGSRERSWSGLLAPLIPLALTDLFFGWHATIPFTYGGMVIITLLGRLVKSEDKLHLALITLTSSAVFFIVSNLGAWLLGGLYPHTLSGLISTFVSAVPFYQNALAGDLAFTILFWGCPALIKRLSRCSQTSPANAGPSKLT